jgi:hypothetical protein
MPIHIRAFAIALSIVGATAYLLGAVLHVISPWGAPALVAYIVHVDVAPLARSFTWDSFVVGLAIFAAVAAVLGALTAWLYNMLAHRTATATLAGKAAQASRTS